MARTLIIKNADFSVNKLATVTFNDIPCTGISLNKSTSSISFIGNTETLTATVTPADTTDAIIWSTSDEDVATVAGGVVTAVGCGTATITATCGDYTATCVFTVIHIANLTITKNMYLGMSTHDYLNGGALDNYCIGYSSSGTKRLFSNSGNEGKYPFPIPNGAHKIVIENTGFKPYGFWLSSTQGSVYGSNIALAYATDSFASQPSNAGNRTVDIPDRTTGTYAGMDAVGIVFRFMNGTVSDSDVATISVTFTA